MRPTRSQSTPAAKSPRRRRESGTALAITAQPAPLALEPPKPKAEGAAERHHRMVAEAAYFRSLNRGLNGGDPQEDWYVSEREILHATGAHF